jgi:hypothetical protein
MPQNEPTVQATLPPDADESSRFEDEHAENEQWLEEAEELPRRPRSRLLTPISMALVAVLLAAVGFIAGTRIEKQEASGSSSGVAGSSGSTAAGASGSSSGVAGSSGSTAAGTSGTGATGKAAGSGARGVGASGAGSSQPTNGTVAYVSGTTLYVTDSEGNTVKVKTTKGTSISKTVTESVAKIHPGESVTVIGSKSSRGSVAAKTITIGKPSSRLKGFAGAKPSAGGAPGGAGAAGGAPGGAGAAGGALPGGGPPAGAPSIG